MLPSRIYPGWYAYWRIDMDNSSIFIIPTISEDTVGLYIPSDRGEWEEFYGPSENFV